MRRLGSQNSVGMNVQYASKFSFLHHCGLVYSLSPPLCETQV